MKAILRNSRQAPRKMRSVASLVQGKSVAKALDILAIAPKRAAAPIHKLISSAVANARVQGISVTDLIVKECRVDSGITLKRIMPGARGSAFPIKKHTSHVLVTLALPVSKQVSAPQNVKKVETETEKSPKAKVVKAKKVAKK
jgi:large subunit ribosomal protein L22